MDHPILDEEDVFFHCELELEIGSHRVNTRVRRKILLQTKRRFNRHTPVLDDEREIKRCPFAEL
jgi:hypothetical protein